MAGPNGESGPVPSSNESVSAIESIVSGSSGFQQGLSWLRTYAKPIGSVSDLGSVQGYYWFQNTNQGNCNTNPVPAAVAGTDGGNIQCQNCSISAVNCANCDNQSYLQSACNCACTYNCTTNTDQVYNCNCNCNCNCLACACACW
jgi:hypothetical protein